MNIFPVLALAGITAIASWLGSMWIRRFLVHNNVFDIPGERSSHYHPVPRGGGIPIVLTTLVGWGMLLQIGLEHTHQVTVISGVVLLIMLVSWFDDVGNISAGKRLTVHCACVTVAVILLPLRPVDIPYLPILLETLLTAFLWLYFINIFNFMDGIDGLSGVETVSICLGIVVTAGFLGASSDFSCLAIIIAASATGFLAWNWQPAKLFLGDVGSIPLGFLLGWLLIELAAEGHWPAALILPSYYFADATLTLVYRSMKMEPVWRGHREHFYQRAVAGKLTHSQASRAIGIANVWLICCALVSTIMIPVGLLGAGLGVCILLSYFQLAAQQIRA